MDPSDVGHLTEGQAWDRYALLGRLASSRARYGVNTFQVGRLWEHAPGGPSRVIRRTATGACEPTFAASLVEPELLLLPVPAGDCRATLVAEVRDRGDAADPARVRPACAPPLRVA